MKQFCLCLLCYLAGTAQINYFHLSHSSHYFSCKHISQLKCLWAHLAILSLALETTGRFGFPMCRKQSIKETQCHFRDMVPAASSTDSCLPGRLNVWDLSVSISQLISPVHLAAASAAHSFCFFLSVSPRSRHPRSGYRDGTKQRDRKHICGSWRRSVTPHPHVQPAAVDTHPSENCQLHPKLFCAFHSHPRSHIKIFFSSPTFASTTQMPKVPCGLGQRRTRVQCNGPLYPWNRTTPDISWTKASQFSDST